MINVIAIDSLRNLPANAATGLALPFFYLLITLVFFIPTILITAELATRYPKTGGSYVWVREAFGPRWGFFSVWLLWIYNIFWYPTILTFIAVHIAYLIDPNLSNIKLFIVPLVVTLFLLATLANAYGMQVSSWLTSASAFVGTIVPMIFIILLGTIWIFSGKPLAIGIPNWHKAIPNLNQMPNIAFLVLIFFSLMGIEMSATHAEEVKNPKRDFPKALYYSAIIILITLILSSTAIAMVVSPQQLNIITGLAQAFDVFLSAFHLHGLLPLVLFIIILGGFGGMAAWVIGPTKGLMAAAKDGLTSPWFAKQNQRGVPINILLTQAAIVILLCSLFLLIPSFNTSYWLLSDLSAQMALLYYVLLFATAIKLRYKKDQPHKSSSEKTFQIPGGKTGIWMVGTVGIIACGLAFLIGFIPPKILPVGNVFRYELLLIGGLGVFCALAPLVGRLRSTSQ